MKNQIRNFATSLGLTAVLGASFLYSESMPAETATVPFAFQIQQEKLPAGPYALYTVDNAGVMRIRNMTTGNTIMFLAHPPLATKPGETKLIFHRYGDRYFLSQVWTADATRIDVVQGAREKEIAKSAGGLVAMAVVKAAR